MTRGEATDIMWQWVYERRAKPFQATKEAQLRQVALLWSALMNPREEHPDLDLDALADFADHLAKWALVEALVGRTIRPSQASAAIWVGLEAVLLGLEDG